MPKKILFVAAFFCTYLLIGQARALSTNINEFCSIAPQTYYNQAQNINISYCRSSHRDPNAFDNFTGIYNNIGQLVVKMPDASLTEGFLTFYYYKSYDATFDWRFRIAYTDSTTGITITKDIKQGPPISSPTTPYTVEDNEITYYVTNTYVRATTNIKVKNNDLVSINQIDNYLGSYPNPQNCGSFWPGNAWCWRPGESAGWRTWDFSAGNPLSGALYSFFYNNNRDPETGMLIQPFVLQSWPDTDNEGCETAQCPGDDYYDFEDGLILIALTPDEIPGYLSTQGGDMFLKEGYKMPSFDIPTLVGASRTLSDYLYSFTTSFANTNCGTRCSKSSYKKTGYVDQNNSYLNFANLSKSINERATELGVSASTLAPNLVNYNSASKRVINVSGNLTVVQGTVCATPTIYLVDGDLTINPDFTIQNYTNAGGKSFGCMFIISGKLIITEGTKAGVGAYDLIHAFVIMTSKEANSIDIAKDTQELNSLRIIGGIVGPDESRITTSVKRVGASWTTGATKYLLPTEEIIYEGGRYVNLFGDFFIDTATQYNINELPYINTL